MRSRVRGYFVFIGIKKFIDIALKGLSSDDSHMRAKLKLTGFKLDPDDRCKSVRVVHPQHGYIFMRSEDVNNYLDDSLDIDGLDSSNESTTNGIRYVFGYPTLSLPLSYKTGIMGASIKSGIVAETSVEGILSKIKNNLFDLENSKVLCENRGMTFQVGKVHEKTVLQGVDTNKGDILALFHTQDDGTEYICHILEDDMLKIRLINRDYNNLWVVDVGLKLGESISFTILRVEVLKDVEELPSWIYDMGVSIHV